MTLALPPSMMATQELVVPRSMPMIFAMFWSAWVRLRLKLIGFCLFAALTQINLGLIAPGSRRRSAGRARHHHHRRAQQALVQTVAPLHDAEYVVGRHLGRRHRRHVLMQLRIE